KQGIRPRRAQVSTVAGVTRSRPARSLASTIWDMECLQAERQLDARRHVTAADRVGSCLRKCGVVRVRIRGRGSDWCGVVWVGGCLGDAVSAADPAREADDGLPIRVALRQPAEDAEGVTPLAVAVQLVLAQPPVARNQQRLDYIELRLRQEVLGRAPDQGAVHEAAQLDGRLP